MLKILPFHAEHAHAAAELHATSFSRPWSVNDFHGYALRQDIIGSSAFEGSKIVGFTLARKTLDEAEILTIITSSERRNQGVGKELLEYIFKFLLHQGTKNVYLEVAKDNHSAKAMYRQMGFTQTGQRPAYYPTTDGTYKPAFIYEKPL